MIFLVVEDKVAAVLGKVLQKLGHIVELAESGEAALEIMHQVQVDFFLIDWMLPGMTGLDLVARIREQERYRETPVVMISSRSGKEDIAVAVAAGIDSYLAKPFSPAQLKQKIEAVLQQRRAVPVNNALQQVLKGHQAFNPTAGDPLVLLAFGARTEDDLAGADPVDIACLEAAVSAIQALNRENSWFNLGYLLAESTGEMAQYLKKWSIRERMMLAVLWTRCKGNIPVLGRLLSVQGIDDVALYMVCPQRDGLSGEMEQACEDGGMTLLERGGMDEGAWSRLIDDQVQTRWG
ncbi:MAG TPA: response regulator [Candidatus Latescibacteria bacterium]|nr:response regulator [Candidatus Handelsmanbacteria bacterium]HIL10404.1 response regulator [Candidatus Latescibacterota bacterium]